MIQKVKRNFVKFLEASPLHFLKNPKYAVLKLWKYKLGLPKTERKRNGLTDTHVTFYASLTSRKNLSEH